MKHQPCKVIARRGLNFLDLPGIIQDYSDTHNLHVQIVLCMPAKCTTNPVFIQSRDCVPVQKEGITLCKLKIPLFLTSCFLSKQPSQAVACDLVSFAVLSILYTSIYCMYNTNAKF